MKTTIILTAGFVLGLIATAIFIVYVFAFVCYISDDTIVYPGAIAYTPKWVFCFVPLVSLGMTKRVKGVLLRVEKLFDPDKPEPQRNKLPGWDR